MKRFFTCSISAAAFALVLPSVNAQSQAESKQSQVHKAFGTVTKVEPGKASVTISHGPVQSMNWPSMVMDFKLKDKALLDSLKQGEKVEFSFVQSGKDYTITQVK